MDNQELVRYKEEYDDFMKEWAEEGFKWLNDRGYIDSERKPLICQRMWGYVDKGDKKTEGMKIYFYKDGFFDIKTWYEEDERERVLFVLKDVNQSEEPKNPSSFGEENQDTNMVMFTQLDGEDCDPEGTATVWKNLREFARKIFDDRISGEKEILKKISIINLKKFSSGGGAFERKSLSTGCFMEHSSQFAQLLKKQINLLSPGLIVCCGDFVDFYVKMALEQDKKQDDKIVSINHPSYCKFWDKNNKKTWEGIDNAKSRFRAANKK